MSDPNANGSPSDPSGFDSGGYFDSSDCIYIDEKNAIGPPDRTHRPLTGKARELALKMREYIEFWEKWRKENENVPNPEFPKDAPPSPYVQGPRP